MTLATAAVEQSIINNAHTSAVEFCAVESGASEVEIIASHLKAGGEVELGRESWKLEDIINDHDSSMYWTALSNMLAAKMQGNEVKAKAMEKAVMAELDTAVNVWADGISGDDYTLLRIK